MRPTLLAVTPSRTELVPWTDRKGRPSLLRGSVFTLLLLPAAWLLFRTLTRQLGADPIATAIHSTGYWTIWLLVGSLVVTPARAVTGLPNVVVVRRMVGNAALLYGLLHLCLYCQEQDWKLATVVSEIVKRFYLTIGFAALLGLLVLGLTSTDGWIWALGQRWKRLHRLVYALTVLGLVHYMLQSKLDVSQALLATGIFAWLMLWRLLPAGPDRSWAPLAGVAAAASALTLGAEWAWYRFETRVDPAKVLRGELDVTFGLHPAVQVLVLGLFAVVGLAVWRRVQGGWGQRAWFTVALYAVVGALADDAATIFFGWMPDDSVWPMWEQNLVAAGVLGALGVVRWRLRERWERRLVDAVWLSAVAWQLSAAQSGTMDPAVGVAVLCLGVCLVAAWRVWRVSRPWGAALAPLGVLLAYGAVTLL